MSQFWNAHHFMKSKTVTFARPSDWVSCEADQSGFNVTIKHDLKSNQSGDERIEFSFTCRQTIPELLSNPVTESEGKRITAKAIKHFTAAFKLKIEDVMKTLELRLQALDMSAKRYITEFKRTKKSGWSEEDENTLVKAVNDIRDNGSQKTQEFFQEKIEGMIELIAKEAAEKAISWAVKQGKIKKNRGDLTKAAFTVLNASLIIVVVALGVASLAGAPALAAAGATAAVVLGGLYLFFKAYDGVKKAKEFYFDYVKIYVDGLDHFQNEMTSAEKALQNSLVALAQLKEKRLPVSRRKKILVADLEKAAKDLRDAKNDDRKKVYEEKIAFFAKKIEQIDTILARTASYEAALQQALTLVREQAMVTLNKNRKVLDHLIETTKNSLDVTV